MFTSSNCQFEILHFCLEGLGRYMVCHVENAAVVPSEDLFRVTRLGRACAHFE